MYIKQNYSWTDHLSISGKILIWKLKQKEKRAQFGNALIRRTD